MRGSTMRVAFVLGALLFAGSTGCAGVQQAGGSGVEEAESPPERQVDLAPTIVSAGEGGGEVVHTKEAFERAHSAFEESRYEEAVRGYRRIVRHASGSRFFRPALYNMGLAAEKLERWEVARRAYRRTIEEFPGGEATNDAFFRLAGVLAEEGESVEAAGMLGQVLLRDGLEPYERVEANVRRGERLREAGRLEDAKNAFRNAMSVREKSPDAVGLAADSALVVRANLGLGRVQHAEMAQIELTLPVENMGEQLESKSEKLLFAQHSYLEAVRAHHAKWSVAAGYQLGQLFEDFYCGVHSAEYPDHLTDDQRAIYFTELRKRIRPVLERAVGVYERNLDLSRRLEKSGGSEEAARWRRKTRERLERVRRMLEKPQTLSRATGSK